MPTDCPGRGMTYDELEHVYAGQLDYRFGEGWVKGSREDAMPFGRRGLK